PRIIGKAHALELILTGRMINAEEALSIGLVNSVTEAGQALEKAESLANEIAAKGQISIKAAKNAINNGLNTNLRNGIELEMALFSGLFNTDDQKEGMDAFLHKHKPVFTDK
ncbi:MAG: enoyl-CoA hydratase-related protein, partial [Dehalobacterium sp.]